MKILYKPVASKGGVSVSYPQPIPMQPMQPMQPIQPVLPTYPVSPGPGHYMPGQAPQPGQKR